MSLPVLAALVGPGEAQLVAGLERCGRDVRVVRRCADLAELLAAACAGIGRVALVSADLPRLDLETVSRLGAVGVAVVGMTPTTDPASAERLRRLGIRYLLPEGSEPERVADLALAAVADRASRGHPDPVLAPVPRPDGVAGPAGGRPGETAAEPLGGAPDGVGPVVPPVPPDGTAEPTAAAGGRVIAVWGPAGAPGRTTVALTLAAELAHLGRPTLLVDADTYGASLAAALGLLEESAGLAAAVRAANHAGLDLERLARLAPEVMPSLRVLTGLPRPQRWPELRASGLDMVWGLARRLAEVTVVDCGFCLEADEELSFDSAAPRRNQATLSAIEAADQVVVVGSADPIGLHRLVRGLQDLGAWLPPGTVPRVLVNRVRGSAVGPDPGRRLRRALLRYAGVDDAVLVPDDRPACDGALLEGRALTEHAPRSPARTAIARLAAEVAGCPAPRRRRGWVAGRRSGLG